MQLKHAMIKTIFVDTIKTKDTKVETEETFACDYDMGDGLFVKIALLFLEPHDA